MAPRATELFRPSERLISLRAAVRRLFDLASSSHYPRSSGGMFDRAQNTNIQNSTFIITNYGEVVADRPGAGSSRGSDQATSTSSGHGEYNPPPSPRRKSPDIYVDCLLTKNCGYPLWIPSPSTSLPTLNRKLGVSPGDVGVFTPEGGFDYLFNILHDATHSINAAVGVPEGFVPFSPVMGPEFIEWNAGSYLADSSIIRVDDGRDLLKTILEATGPEAAVLMIPKEIRTAQLRITMPLRKYVEEHIAAWYKFVRHTLGHEIENGDLRVVYGCRKSSGFGIATAFNTGQHTNTKLTFSINSAWAGISGCPYHWSHTGSAEVKAGPSQDENSEISVREPVRNQCLFVSTIDAKVSAEIWKQIEELGIATTMDKKQHLTFNTTPPQDGSTQQPTGQPDTQETTNPPPRRYHERAFHPSVILHNLLETIVPGLPVYMVCDDDWTDFITSKDMNPREFVQQVLEKRIILEYQGMAYFSEDVNKEIRDEFLDESVGKIQFCRTNRVLDLIATGSYRWQATRKKQSIEEKSSLLKQPSKPAHSKPAGDAYGIKPGVRVGSSKLPVKRSETPVFSGATNTAINNIAVSTTVADVGYQNDIVTLLHSHSATAGLLDAKERFDSPKCDEGTRTSMILGMKRFVQDGNDTSSPALYWLHGPAGVGKSALAQSLSLELKSEGDHAASFFFSRTSPGCNDGNQLIVTLAYQLATNFPALQPFMSKVVKEDQLIFSSSNAVQMQSLIIDPINEWQRKYHRSVRRLAHNIFHSNKKLHPRLILVDGLDECNDRNVQRDLLLCIASAVRQLSIPLRFVIASRPESHILATLELDPMFQDLNGVTVTKKNLMDDNDADEHIMTFLLKEFAEIRRVHPFRGSLPEQWPHSDQIEQLVSKSSKGFIYPATVIRYIKMPNNRPDECLERILGLSEIPKHDKPYEPLDTLYRHIFDSVPEINKSSVRNIFHFLVLPSTWDGVITCTTIERHFDYMPGHVQHVLHDLLCLVALPSGGYIKVLHASLPGFLLAKARSGHLCIDVGDAHTTLAASYLLDICQSEELPSRSSGFANFLEHMMQANMSDKLLHHRINKIDLLARYRKACSQTRVATHMETVYMNSFAAKSLEEVYDLDTSDGAIGGIAFMVAYLLVLVIRCGPHNYIMDQIAAIKAYILQTYPVAGSVHGVHEELIPVMIPLFRDWNATLYDKYISYIFALEFAPSQYQIRDDIFELHFMMMVPFCGFDTSYMPWQQERGLQNEAIKRINWADIVGGRKEAESN